MVDEALSDQPKKVRAAARSPGERMCMFIERYVLVPEGHLVGQPMKLEDFEIKFILDVYNNPHETRRAILSMARKNGKTALIACLALGHILGPSSVQNGQVVSGALSREQAGLVYRLAEKMVLMSPQLSSISRCIPSTKRIHGLNTGSEYRALAADGATAFGLSPNVVILDEIGQIKGPTHLFIDALTTSQGAHLHPMQFVISTQAPHDGDLLSIWIDDALRGLDPHTIVHLYKADEGCELLDPKAWIAANPGLGRIRSKDDLEQQLKAATRLPSQESAARNLLLNQRVQRDAPFMSQTIWKKNTGELNKELFYDGRPVYGGLDLSSRRDLTSLVLVTMADDGKVHMWTLAWTPADTVEERSKEDRVPYDVWVRQDFLRTTPGSSVSLEVVARECVEATEEMNLVEIHYDRWRIDILENELRRHGLFLPLSEFGQGYKDMAGAVDTFEEYALEGAIRHGDHPVLTSCVANTTLDTDAAGNRKPVKQKSHGRIDCCVAALMALASMRKNRDAAVDVLSLIG